MKLTAAKYLERRSALRLEHEAAQASYADKCRLAATGECSDADHRQAKSDLDLASDKLASLEVAFEEQCRVDRLGEMQAARERWEADHARMIAEADGGLAAYGAELGNIVQRLRVIGEDYRARRSRVKAIANRHKPSSAGLLPGEGLMRFAAHRDLNNNAEISEKSAAHEVEKLLGGFETIADDALQALNAGRPPEFEKLEVA